MIIDYWPLFWRIKSSNFLFVFQVKSDLFSAYNFNGVLLITYVFPIETNPWMYMRRVVQIFSWRSITVELKQKQKSKIN